MKNEQSFLSKAYAEERRIIGPYLIACLAVILSTNIFTKCLIPYFQIETKWIIVTFTKTIDLLFFFLFFITLVTKEDEKKLGRKFTLTEKKRKRKELFFLSINLEIAYLVISSIIFYFLLYFFFPIMANNLTIAITIILFAILLPPVRYFFKKKSSVRISDKRPRKRTLIFKKLSQKEKLVQEIKFKKSSLIICLDIHPDNMPSFLTGVRGKIVLLDVLKIFIGQTHDLVAGYKINKSYYELLGKEGLNVYYEIIQYLKIYYSELIIIDDSKHGEYGLNAVLRAKTSFEIFQADATTILPQLGKTSYIPFLNYKNNWSIIVSGIFDKSPGMQESNNYCNPEEIIPEITVLDELGEKTMFFVNPRSRDSLRKIRTKAPNHFLLVHFKDGETLPLNDLLENGYGNDFNLLIVVSKLVHASDGKDFASAARAKALKLQEQIESFMLRK